LKVGFLTKIKPRNLNSLTTTNGTSTIKKTKEMLLGAVNGNEIGQLIVNVNTIARVSTFKLLGVQVESILKWNSHVDYIRAKAFSLLYFFKQ